jgi:hypothetical protein
VIVLQVESVEALEEIISDPDSMRMQALLVRERILGPAHPDTSYYIRYRLLIISPPTKYNSMYNSIQFVEPGWNLVIRSQES